MYTLDFLPSFLFRFILSFSLILIFFCIPRPNVFDSNTIFEQVFRFYGSYNLGKSSGFLHLQVSNESAFSIFRAVPALAFLWT